ncbi:PEP-CTERM protein-sorting domain-containing protein [Anaerohalosphaera lusitana]|uniref:PEP-CTERM protein-sorting domain-containing protein n=1 Tax=Anaerohalosphaera lusitana TaxID=1936003 RepID=A0A1U9NMJ9_9BACT|nr:LamG-like jellyroll fold domain-containing protein [Anaerohalosphaera lusitana]AQT68964.1 PEP-CTERM protein-sorting domain-containing protein [Anaerohalosphaera lusitana]
MMKARVILSMVVVALVAQVSFGGLVGQWTFDDPQNPGGTIYGDPVFSSGDMILDGDDGLNTGINGVAGAGARTISAWVKVDDGNYGGSIISYGDHSATGLGTRFTFKINNDSGVLRCEIAGGFSIGTTSVTDGQWHHVALTTAEGDGDTANVKFYIDGQQDAVADYGNANPIDSDAAEMSIGYSKAFYDLGWAGAMELIGGLDDVRVYDEQLSSSEVAALVPEPATMSLLAIGAFGLISSRKRK